MVNTKLTPLPISKKRKVFNALIKLVDDGSYNVKKDPDNEFQLNLGWGRYIRLTEINNKIRVVGKLDEYKFDSIVSELLTAFDFNTAAEKVDEVKEEKKEVKIKKSSREDKHQWAGVLIFLGICLLFTGIGAIIGIVLIVVGIILYFVRN